jgi:hypothetical protein
MLGGGQCKQGAGMGKRGERHQGLPFRLAMQRRAPGSGQRGAQVEFQQFVPCNKHTRVAATA